MRAQRRAQEMFWFKTDLSRIVTASWKQPRSGAAEGNGHRQQRATTQPQQPANGRVRPAIRAKQPNSEAVVL